MTGIYAVLMLACLSQGALYGQSMKPAMGAGAPQTGQSAPSPAPCVEDMPGMQMCPKPAPSGAGTRGMKMDTGMKELMDNMNPRSFTQEILHHASAGTSAEPNATPTPMLMTMKVHGC